MFSFHIIDILRVSFLFCFMTINQDIGMLFSVLQINEVIGFLFWGISIYFRYSWPGRVCAGEVESLEFEATLKERGFFLKIAIIFQGALFGIQMLIHLI